MAAAASSGALGGKSSSSGGTAAAAAARSWTIANLPQRMPGGAFECLYCKERSVHLTRDRLLVHISDLHPDVDLDAVEEYLPSSRLSHCANPRPAPKTYSIPFALPPAATAPSSSSSSGGVADGGGKNFVSGGGIAGKLLDVVFTDECFPCELCGREYVSEKDLLQHLENSHPDGTFAADSNLRRLMSVEMKAMEAAAKAAAADAAASSATAGAPSLMEGQLAAISVVCDLCGTGQGKVFTTVSALFSHIKSKHVQHSAADHTRRMTKEQAIVNTFTCSECQKSFRTAEQLASHRQKHAAAPGGPSMPVALNQAWWCHDCERGFSSPQGLYNHMASKHAMAETPYPCPACKRIFPDVYSLKSHIALAHKNIDPAEIKGENHASCPECMRQFFGDNFLALHWKKHHQARLGDLPKDEKQAGARAASTASPRVVAKRVVAEAAAAAVLSSALTHDITEEAENERLDSASETAASSAETASTSSRAFKAQADLDEEPPEAQPTDAPAERKPRVVVRRKGHSEDE